jgi:energy-coupling factor transporter transmembrane protein EcfT
MSRSCWQHHIRVAFFIFFLFCFSFFLFNVQRGLLDPTQIMVIVLFCLFFVLFFGLRQLWSLPPANGYEPLAGPQVTTNELKQTILMFEMRVVVGDALNRYYGEGTTIV